MNSSPWAKLTTSMIPKIRVRPEATSARIMPVTMPLMVWMRSCSSTLHPQVLMDDGVVVPEIRGSGVMAHHTLLHDVDALARLEGERHVLFHQQDRHAVAVEHVDDLADLRHHARHQAFRRLVQEDDLGREHHGAGYGEHLLLAAREGAAGLVASLGQYREVLVDLVEQRPLRLLRHAATVETGPEVLHDGEEAEDPAVLRHIADTEPRQPMGRHPRDRASLERHRALGRVDQSHP